MQIKVYLHFIFSMFFSSQLYQLCHIYLMIASERKSEFLRSYFLLIMQNMERVVKSREVYTPSLNFAPLILYNLFSIKNDVL